MKGTQLQQLSDDYQVILENIQRADAVLKQKAEAIPDLKMAHRAAVEKYRQATSLVQQQTEIDELIRELAWAHVYEKQKVCGRANTPSFQTHVWMFKPQPSRQELQKSLETAQDAKRHTEKIESKLATAQVRVPICSLIMATHRRRCFQEKLKRVEAEIEEVEKELIAARSSKAPQQATLNAELKTATAKKKELESEKADLEVRGCFT